MHLGEIQKFRNLNFSPLPKINLVLYFSEKFELKPISFGTVLAQFYLGTHLVTLPPL
jgi:hypothetical protein